MWDEEIIAVSGKLYTREACGSSCYEGSSSIKGNCTLGRRGATLRPSRMLTLRLARVIFSSSTIGALNSFNLVSRISRFLSAFLWRAALSSASISSLAFSSSLSFDCASVKTTRNYESISITFVFKMIQAFLHTFQLALHFRLLLQHRLGFVAFHIQKLSLLFLETF